MTKSKELCDALKRRAQADQDCLDADDELAEAKAHLAAAEQRWELINREIDRITAAERPRRKP